MDNPSPQRARLHPLVATAAVALILLSVVGIGAVVMDRSNAQSSPYDAPATVAQTPADAAKPAPVAEAPSTPARVATATNTPAPALSTPSTPVYENPPVVQAAAAVCRDCGVVDSIREIKVKGQGTGVGAVGGAVVGGLVGNMVGAGRGKALATVAGAVGGGLGGNAIEKNVRSTVEHQMIVRLDNGASRTFRQASPFPYREGERVRIVDGHVERA